MRAIAAADLLIVGGTSLAVYPAAGLLRYFGGSELVVINATPTPADAGASPGAARKNWSYFGRMTKAWSGRTKNHKNSTKTVAFYPQSWYAVDSRKKAGPAVSRRRPELCDASLQAEGAAQWKGRSRSRKGKGSLSAFPGRGAPWTRAGAGPLQGCGNAWSSCAAWPMWWS